MKDATTFIDELKDKVHELFEENKELKKRIEKAIEYIEKEKVIKEGNTLEQITNYEKNILEILKGELKWKS